MKCACDLKPKKTAERECLRDLFGRGMAPVRFEHMLVEALHAHLDFGTAEGAHKGERLAIDGVGARLDDEAHVAVCGVYVVPVLAENVVERGVLHGRYMLPSVIFAVEFTNRLGVRFFALVYALLSFLRMLEQAFRGYAKCPLRRRTRDARLRFVGGRASLRIGRPYRRLRCRRCHCRFCRCGRELSRVPQHR